MRRTPAWVVLPVLVALAAASLLLARCGSSSSGPPSSSRPARSRAAPASPSEQITVLAAASLTESFTTIGQQFEAAHAGIKVLFSFGASSSLATQITQGAPADVFASASTEDMGRVVAARAAENPKIFARNAMTLALPPANPMGITQLFDLAKPGVKVALCAEVVPCGSVARRVLAKAKLTVRPVTYEADVKATLAKVILGEVDGGLVYVTDVLGADSKVKGIPIPADVNASTSYAIATLSGSKNPDLAKALVDYVLSVDGAAVLNRAGFENP